MGQNSSSALLVRKGTKRRPHLAQLLAQVHSSPYICLLGCLYGKLDESAQSWSTLTDQAVTE